MIPTNVGPLIFSERLLAKRPNTMPASPRAIITKNQMYALVNELIRLFTNISMIDTIIPSNPNISESMPELPNRAGLEFQLAAATGGVYDGGDATKPRVGLGYNEGCTGCSGSV